MAVTPPAFNYANFIAAFPAFDGIPEATIELAWEMGGNWLNQLEQASWGLGCNQQQWQQAADLMGAVICKQLFGTAAEYAAEGDTTTADEAPGAIESATEGSVTANFQVPEIGTSAFASMLLASPPYGRLLLGLLQIASSVGPYIPSCRPSRVPP